jgi:hypothetical protein
MNALRARFRTRYAFFSVSNIHCTWLGRGQEMTQWSGLTSHGAAAQARQPGRGK